MSIILRFLVVLSIAIITGCTTKGRLEYIATDGSQKFVCETEYSGLPSVDQYAVEYTLSYCADKINKQGHQVIDKRLLSLDLSIPKEPNGKIWTFEIATQMHNMGELTDKEYGYIVAYIDLGLASSNETNE